MPKFATWMAVLVTGLAAVGGVVVASPASAEPGHAGQGGTHTNRYQAQACQHGGYTDRVEAETGRPFANAGDCTSHTALNGSLGGTEGTVTLTSSPLYRCPAPSMDACWGYASVSSTPGGDLLIIAKSDGSWSRSAQLVSGTQVYNADIPCSVSGAGSQFYATVPAFGTSADVTPPACS